MADVTFRAEFDDSQVQAGIKRNIEGVESLQGEFDELGEKASGAMDDVAKATKGATGEVGKMPPAIGKAAKSTGVLSAAMRVLGTVLKTLGIGAIVAAGAALIAAFLKAKPVTDALSDAFSAMDRIVTTLIDRAVVFGRGIAQIFSGDVKGGIESISQSVDGLGASLVAAAAAGIQASRALRSISEQEEDLALDIAQQSERLARLKAVRDDDTKSIRERQAAARQAGETEREFQARNLQLLQERLAIANQEAAARKEQDKSLAGTNRLTKEQQELLIQIGQAQGKLAESDLDAARAQASLRKEASAAGKARREELAELEKQAAAFLAQLEKLRAGQLSGIDRVRAERELAIKAINDQEAELRKVFAERRKEFTLEAEFEQARAIVSAQASKEIRGILLGEARERQAILEKARQAENKALADSQKERLADIEIGKQILLARVDLIERAGETEEEFAIQIARRRLQIEINAQRERLEVVSAQYGENSPEVQLARAQIALLEKEYQKAGEISVTGFQALKAKILSALGITEEEAGLVLQQAGAAISSIAGLIGAGTEAQLAQQDKLLDSIRSRISETESLLREEQRRAAQGYANNVLLFEDSLKKQQEAEAAAEKERAKLQEQATKRQLKQNQLQAISEYGLLVIKLLSAEASKGIIGVAIGIAGLALVARIVAQQKQAAAKLLEPGFREGTAFVEGPGNSRSDSIAARLSRGERVLPARDNMEIGGRAMSNQELVRLVKLGRLASAGSFAPANAQARRDQESAAEMRVMVDMKVAEKAYREAAEAAAEKVVAAIDAKPTVIQAGNATIVERKGGKKEVYIGQQAKK